MTDDVLVRAALSFEGSIFIHNQLANTAHHLRARILAGIESENREGIGLDMIAAVTMIAFSFEAYLNFVGFKLDGDGFKEFAPAHAKRDWIMGQLGIQWDTAQRPFSTIDKLAKVRNALAHGKPEHLKKEWESVGTHTELEEEISTFRQGIFETINVDLVVQGFEDVEAVWLMMRRAANINHFETLDGGAGSMTFLEHVERNG